LTCLSHGRSILEGKNGIPRKKVENPEKGTGPRAVFAKQPALSSELSLPIDIDRSQASVSQTRVSSLYYVYSVNKT
jgi:hypothetical protein